MVAESSAGTNLHKPRVRTILYADIELRDLIVAIAERSLERVDSFSGNTKRVWAQLVG